MNVKEFFNNNPLVEKVLVVKGELFLIGFELQAQNYANKISANVELVERLKPNKKAIAESIETNNVTT